MRIRTLICGAAAAALLAGSALAAEFPDTEGHWAGASIDRWSAAGVIDGYADGRFGPDDPITRGQMAAILDRLLGWTEQAENGFQDMTGGEWYAGAVLRANAAGVLSGSAGFARPEDPITRQEAVVMLERALALEYDGEGRTFGDEAQIGGWAREAVNTLSGLGLVTGADNGNFEPLRSITRAETMAVLDRAVGGYYDQAGVYTQGSSGVAALVTAPGVTLQNLTIEGDLLIAPGAEGSETILRDVTVTGTVRVLSGREAQILILGSSTLGALEVAGTDSRLRLERAVDAFFCRMFWGVRPQYVKELNVDDVFPVRDCFAVSAEADLNDVLDTWQEIRAAANLSPEIAWYFRELDYHGGAPTFLLDDASQLERSTGGKSALIRRCQEYGASFMLNLGDGYYQSLPDGSFYKLAVGETEPGSADDAATYGKLDWMKIGPLPAAPPMDQGSRGCSI